MLELARLLRAGSAGCCRPVLTSGRDQLQSDSKTSAAHFPAQILDASAASIVSLFLLQVDQPLCAECATRVREQIEARLAEVRADCAAYEAALARLAAQDLQPLSEEVTDLVTQ